MYVFLVSSAVTTGYKIKILCNYFLKKGNWKLKENTNWILGDNLLFTQDVYIRKKKQHVRKQGNLVPQWQESTKKRCEDSADKIIASSTFVSCTRWNTKKGLTFCQKGVKRLRLTRRTLFQLVSSRTTLLWIMHITSDNVLFMTKAILFSECA